MELKIIANQQKKQILKEAKKNYPFNLPKIAGGTLLVSGGLNAYFISVLCHNPTDLATIGGLFLWISIASISLIRINTAKNEVANNRANFIASEKIRAQTEQENI